MNEVDHASSSYPKNSPSIFQRRVEDTFPFENLTMKYHWHTNSAGVKMTLLPLIDEPLDRPKVFAVGEFQPFERSEALLEDTTSQPPVIHSDQ